MPVVVAAPIRARPISEPVSISTSTASALGSRASGSGEDASSTTSSPVSTHDHLGEVAERLLPHQAQRRAGFVAVCDHATVDRVEMDQDPRRRVIQGRRRVPRTRPADRIYDVSVARVPDREPERPLEAVARPSQAGGRPMSINQTLSLPIVVSQASDWSTEPRSWRPNLRPDPGAAAGRPACAPLSAS